MTRNLALLWKSICSTPSGAFLVHPAARVSYKTLRQQIELACGVFDERDLGIGDRILISLSDEFSASATFLAALLDGLVPVLFSPDAPQERRASIIAFLRPALVIDDNTPPPTPRGLLNTLLARGIRARPPRLPNLPIDQLAYIIFSSGTIATPKGVEITHGNLFAQIETLIRLFGYSSGSRILNATPLAHTDGLVQGPILTAASGATLLRPGKFEVGQLNAWLDFLRSETPTHMLANPTLLSIMLRIAEEDDYFMPAVFKGVISTGGNLSEQLWEAFEKRFGVRVWNAYGMTETVANALYAGDHPEMGARGTIGRPVDCCARIAGYVEEGELELSGENISPGYWCNAEHTEQAHTADGWLRTGDIVRRRQDGSYEYLGRTRAIINQGAVRISPEEISEAVLNHPKVMETVTVSLPDVEFEEIAVTAVVLSQPETPTDLVAHVNLHLEPLKRPKRIVPLERIPKTDSGKADLLALRALLQTAADNSSLERPMSSPLDEQLRMIAANVFGVEPAAITLDTPAANIPGWDSFNHLKLIIQTEATLDVAIPTKDIVSIRSLRALADAVARQLQQRK